MQHISLGQNDGEVDILKGLTLLADTHKPLFSHPETDLLTTQFWSMS